MKKFFAILSFAAALTCAFGSDIDDFKAYDCGKSLSWFFNMRSQSTRSDAGKLEEKILDVLRESQVSDEAFRLACKVLKPIASSDSIEVLAKFLDSDIRATAACDVLIGIDDSDVDEVLAESLKSAKGKAAIEIVFALGARGNDDSVPALAEAAESSDKDLSLCAVAALSRIKDSAAFDALKKIASKDDYRKTAAVQGLCARAAELVREGDRYGAAELLKSVPEDYSESIWIRGELAGDGKTEYLDSIIISGGKNAKYAARAMSGVRAFEKSGLIISKFDSMDDSSKIMAIASFMNAGDVRFWPTIVKCLDAKDKNLKSEAIYAARFICADEASLSKIYSIFKGGEEPFASLSRDVCLENASLAMPKILRDAELKGDRTAQEILILRGDTEARDRLWKEFFGDSTNPAAAKLLENTITYGELGAFASKFKEVKDQKLRGEMAKIIIKKLAKSKDNGFIRSAAPKILEGNLSKDSPEYQLIASKLKLK